MKAYLYDPLGDKAREVKARYRGACRNAARRPPRATARATPTPIASAAIPGRSSGNGTREPVREAMRAWRARYGAPPSSYDWSRTHARRSGATLKRLQAGEWPAPSTVIDLYELAAALADALAAPERLGITCRP